MPHNLAGVAVLLVVAVLFLFQNYTCVDGATSAPLLFPLFFLGISFFFSGGQFSLTCKNHDIPLRF